MCSQIINTPNLGYFTSIGFASPHFCYRRSRINWLQKFWEKCLKINCFCLPLCNSYNLQKFYIAPNSCDISLYTQKILRSRAIACFVSLSKYEILQVFLTKEAREWCEVFAVHLILMGASMFIVHTWRKICSYFINLIFIIKKFMNLMYNPSFISFLQHMPDWSMLLLFLHFCGHH